MSPILDWILILISTLLTYKAYKYLVYNRYCSVAYYVIPVVYFFCCIPIALNYLIGIPQYNVIYWYKSFIPAMNNVDVAIIYDMYILTSIISLYIYGKKASKKLQRHTYLNSFQLSNENEHKIVYVLGVVSPLLYALISGNASKLMVYTTMQRRNVDTTDSIILGALILTTLYCICILTFSGEITKRKLILLIPLSIMITWLQGKRYILAVMGIFYLFFLTKSKLTTLGRKYLFWAVPLLLVALIAFSALYLVFIKPLSVMDFYSIYDMLRVDFGRDDVIKFVIYKEFFTKEHILDYPGQSFFSTLFTYIPRIIWTTKPYSHYKYLTSAILGVSIDKIPAGTTPSWYEMCLCNFSYLGFILGVFGLILFCVLADKMIKIKAKAIVFMLIVVLLTQNTDVYNIYIFLMFMYYFLQHVKHPKIKFKWRENKIESNTL